MASFQISKLYQQVMCLFVIFVGHFLNEICIVHLLLVQLCFKVLNFKLMAGFGFVSGFFVTLALRLQVADVLDQLVLFAGVHL